MEKDKKPVPSSPLRAHGDYKEETGEQLGAGNGQAEGDKVADSSFLELCDVCVLTVDNSISSGVYSVPAATWCVNVPSAPADSSKEN